ncbi:LytTR family DNA-binding domain-containing protein [Pseudomonas aeruginosa]|uniref:LytTR family DNA-binding domain-containing protein n=1 Tax=Pseudomonas aeruginosa TaxID=287 RepID=UPI0021F1D1D6|nr:LytTR family DNA-binding domain-containing protein [Pseudomonas aeruginosa]MCV6451569.1 LytTR family transcriptional regulator [Pseudomonas aeruginosa]
MRTVLKATCGKHSKEISVSQITHFVAEDKYVIAYYPDGVLVLNETLKALETEFADEFIRAHRKALVRRSLISMFKTRPDDSKPARYYCSEPRTGYLSAAATQRRSNRR